MVFGVHHDHRAMAARHLEHLQHLMVIQAQGIVGHVYLERRIAVFYQGGKFLTEHLFAGIGNDQVEGVIDHRLGIGACVIVLHYVAQGLPVVLSGKGNDGGGAAECRGHAAGIKIIGAHHPG